MIVSHVRSDVPPSQTLPYFAREGARNGFRLQHELHDVVRAARIAEVQQGVAIEILAMLRDIGYSGVDRVLMTANLNGLHTHNKNLLVCWRDQRAALENASAAPIL